jgi:hypothetical protein
MVGVAVALAVSACGGASTPQQATANSATPQTRQYYSVTYPDGDRYDEEVDTAAVAHCVALPGGSNNGARLSLPPIRTLSVAGTTEQVQAFVSCLHDIPGARVTGPFDMPSDADNA